MLVVLTPNQLWDFFICRRWLHGSNWSSWKSDLSRHIERVPRQFRALHQRRSGVNFIIILRSAFAHADPKSVKRHWWLDCLIALLGSARVKAVHKHVGEIDLRAADTSRLPFTTTISPLMFPLTNYIRTLANPGSRTLFRSEEGKDSSR